LESLCLEQVGCGRLGGQLPGVDLAGVQADQVQVGVGEVGAGEQERQPVPAAGGAGGCPGDDEQGPGLQVQGGLFAGFAFGSNGLLTSRDPELQEKTIKFLNLVANSVVLSVAVDITEVLRQLAAEGWEIDPEDFAVLSPNRREVIRRFGDYVTEGLHVPPAPFDPRLDLVTMPSAA